MEEPCLFVTDDRQCANMFPQQLAGRSIDPHLLSGLPPDVVVARSSPTYSPLSFPLSER